YVAQSGQIIQILPHDEYITSNSSGQFMFAPKEYGTYTLRYIGNNRYERGESTRDTTITINDENHSYLNIFFFAKPKLVNDISIFSTVISRPIVGREMILQTTVKNWGETAYNIPIEINFSN